MSMIQTPMEIAMFDLPECFGDSVNCYTGMVSSVIDGDSLVVGRQNIRLTLVDSPELDSSGYDNATNTLMEICDNRHAFVDIDDNQLEGTHGRQIATVWCFDGENWINANEMAILSGNSTVYETFCSVSEFTSSWASDLC